MKHLDQIREIADRVAVSAGLELVDVEFLGHGPNSVLRIFLDKPGGVTHGDCQFVSNQVGAILDVEDIIDSRYTLEVSSPGLNRRLVKPNDYERFAGREVKLVLKTPKDGRRRLRGKLLGVENKTIQMDIEGGQRISLNYDDIEKANLVAEL